MTMRQIYRLVHEQARQRATQAVKSAPDGFVVRISPATRNLEQNALLHALLGEIAATQKYMGRTLTPDQYKVLFISGHAIATGERADVILGIEDEFVNIRESSAAMSVARMTSLIDYIQAWRAQQ